jgi:hypothetical protein
MDISIDILLLSSVSLVSTLPVTLNTRNLPADKGRTELKADILTAIGEPFVQIMREPQRHTTL